MMRTPELKEFAKAHDMKMITVSDLITYRRKTEILVERVTEADLPTKYGDLSLIHISSRRLWSVALAFDFLTYVGCMLIAYQL